MGSREQMSPNRRPSTRLCTRLSCAKPPSTAQTAQRTQRQPAGPAPGGSDDRDLVMEQGLIFGGGGLAVVLCAGLALALIICVCLIRMFVPQCNSLDCCLSWRVMSPVAFASFVTLCCLAVMCVLLMAFAVVGFLIAPT